MCTWPQIVPFPDNGFTWNAPKCLFLIIIHKGIYFFFQFSQGECLDMYWMCLVLNTVRCWNVVEDVSELNITAKTQIPSWLLVPVDPQQKQHFIWQSQEFFFFNFLLDLLTSLFVHQRLKERLWEQHKWIIKTGRWSRTKRLWALVKLRHSVKFSTLKWPESVLHPI